MLYADKQHLKTEVAVDLLRVREKEMNFYSSNLSTVGTQSALLAGFAFAILAQKQFTLGAGGFWPKEWREALGLRPISENDAANFGWTTEELDRGVYGWHWDTALQQVCQLFHLILTTIGMTIQLWTLYTCVLTNILGLSLALRGPEGSVDRAVRHMAEQNQLVMNRFGTGVIIFFVSIMLFSLMEYEIYASIPVCACVTAVFRMMMKNIRSLVNEFWLDQVRRTRTRTRTQTPTLTLTLTPTPTPTLTLTRTPRSPASSCRATSGARPRPPPRCARRRPRGCAARSSSARGGGCRTWRPCSRGGWGPGPG